MRRRVAALLGVFVPMALPSCAALVSFAGFEGAATFDATTGTTTEDARGDVSSPMDAATIGEDASWSEGGGDGAVGNDGGGSLRYLGCFADSKNHDLPYLAYDSSLNTPALCVATCADAGYLFAATQIGDCFCGDAYGGQGPSGACAPCTVDASTPCGGPSANSVYAPSSFVSLDPAPLGCFTDNGTDRDLPYPAYNSSYNTTQACAADCAYHGFLYAGTQYSRQCFCGDSYGAYGPSSSCLDLCTGDQEEICGGVAANNIYRTSVTNAGKDAGPSDAGREAGLTDGADASAEPVDQ
jgi:hypothetical protein